MVIPVKKPVIGIGADLQTTPGLPERVFSFTTYAEALRNAGAIPLLIHPQAENADELLARLDGLLLAGGDDCDPAIYGEERHPSVEMMDLRRQENELALARMAREQALPTLGICLGMQMLNIAAGGSLVQDIDSQFVTEVKHASDPEKRARHDVTIDGSTLLGSVIGGGGVNVNSSHHQAVKRVGEGLRTSATAPDGIVEGIEDPSLPFFVGVQWHPEDMPGEESASKLFQAFVDAAREHRERRA